MKVQTLQKKLSETEQKLEDAQNARALTELTNRLGKPRQRMNGTAAVKAGNLQGAIRTFSRSYAIYCQPFLNPDVSYVNVKVLHSYDNTQRFSNLKDHTSLAQGTLRAVQQHIPHEMRDLTKLSAFWSKVCNLCHLAPCHFVANYISHCHPSGNLA